MSLPASPAPTLAEGAFMHALMGRLWSLPRSLTGPGVRRTLEILGEHLPGLTRHEIPSGSRCLDWEIPPEWTLRAAHLTDPSGRRVVDVADHTLHVVGYSPPVEVELELEALQPHLHSLPDQPDAIPYVTSYYRPVWGFCLPHRLRQTLAPGRYRAVIDADLAPGALSYADLVIPGREPGEIFLSTYICHPAMANNELSGPVLATALARWLLSRSNRYTIRLVWAPESLGAIAYLSRHAEHLRRQVRAAFNLTCVGDERAVSFLPSRRGDTLTDRVARHLLTHRAPGFREYSFLHHRGSDERQYCAPGADLPMVSIMRSKYGTFPEYHTSLDDLTLVTPAGLQGAFDLHREAILLLEANRVWRTTIIGEPHLARRGLSDALGGGTNLSDFRRKAQNLLAYADGSLDLVGLGEVLGLYALELLPLVEQLHQAGLLEEVSGP